MTGRGLYLWAFTIIFAFVFVTPTWAMPPHSDLVEKIKAGEVQEPFFFKNIEILQEKGINTPVAVAIARQIAAQAGDYVLQVKANQGRLHQQLKLTLDEAILLNFDGMPHDFIQTVDGDHGRIETRRLWCTGDIDWVPGVTRWEHLRSVAVVEATRQIDAQSSTQRRYYLSSLPGDDAARMLQIVRGLSNLNIVAADVMEVAPAYDQSEVTALAAATLGLEILHIHTVGA